MDGQAKIGQLIAQAKAFGMPALALTDHGNMFGALNFERECKKQNIKSIIGEEFYVAEKSHAVKEGTKYGGKYYHLILLCENEVGYKNMSHLSSIAYTEGLYYGKPRIDFELLQKYHEGLVCLSACIQGEVAQALLHDDDEHAEEVAKKYATLFGENHFYLEIQDHGLRAQKKVAKKLVALSKKLSIPIVATNDVHYCKREDAEAQDVLRCIGFQTKLSSAHQTMGDGRSEWYFKNENEMRAIFPEWPEAIDNTLKIADMCNCSIPQYKTEELKTCLPHVKIPEGFTTEEDYMRALVEEGLQKRYGKITDEIRERCTHELNTIFSMGFAGYFLIVWEFIHWSKENGIPIGPGRGSGAGSLVAYAMEITDIDPFRFKLIFERFLNPERISMPDFDVDMDFDFRQRIIQHTRDLYGDAQVGHIVTFGTLKPKAVIKDVGRVLDIPLAEVIALTKCIPSDPKAKLADAFTPPDEKHPENGQLLKYKDEERYKKLFELCFKLEGVNRQTGLHASGMVIALSALPNWTPIFKDYKTGEVGVQYTMDVIESCGLVKMDYLGLKTLSIIRYTEDIINKHKKAGDEKFDASKVDETDKATFELFCKGDTEAVFQFESAGMQKVLKQAQPTKIEDLVALNALFRPGPMDYIPNFIEGRFYPDKIKYPDECLKDILEETYGVIVYQEQVMQVAQRIAGYSLGEADILRRAMGKKKKEEMAKQKEKFIAGAIAKGFTAKHASDIFEILVPFAGYGFNKSHAAAYSVLAYRTAFLKCHFPREFMAANLTMEMNSADKLPQYLVEARRMGIEVAPPNVNRSDVVFDVLDGKIVFGLQGIKGVGETAARAIVDERNAHGAYKTFMDFLERVDLKTVNKRSLEALIKTGAFDSLDKNRPTLLCNAERAVSYVENKKNDLANGQEDLFGGTDEKTFADFVFEELEDIPRMEKLNEERELIGIYISGHPLDEYRATMEKCVTLDSKNIAHVAEAARAQRNAALNAGANPWELKNSGDEYIALGLIQELKIIRTKKGDEMAFGKLQDFSGNIEITFFPKTWEKMKAQVKTEEVFAFRGKVDSSRDTASFIVEKIEEVSELKEHAIHEVHIALQNNFSREVDMNAVKEFLCANTGSCSVYFHIDTNAGPYVVKAHPQLQVQSDDATISELSDLPFIKEVWTA